MARYSIYAVAYGIDPDTKCIISGVKYHSWAECLRVTKNVEKAKYKGFLTEMEADAWLEANISLPESAKNVRKPSLVSQVTVPDRVKYTDAEANRIKAAFTARCLSQDIDPGTTTLLLLDMYCKLMEYSLVSGLTDNASDPS